MRALAIVMLLGGGALAEEKLDDAKIATVALTAHQIDVDRGKIAAKRTKNDEVKQLAQQMVDDHSVGVKEVLALAQKLKVKPLESEITKGLKDGAKKTGGQLDKLSGSAFDKAYVDAEIAYHQAVIDAVNKVLVPNVQNAEVKQLLINTGPTLQGHLVHAQQVKALLEKAK